MDQPVSELQFSRYTRLIEYAKQHRPEGRVERRHIIPRSMGGSNDKNNLVELSLRLHFVAHWLLWKSYRNSKMANAFWTMACCNGRRLNSKTYDIVRSVAAKSIAESKRGKTTSAKQKAVVSALMSGKVFSKETCQRISKAKTGKKQTAEHKAKVAAQRIGKKLSLETREKMSAAKRGKKPNNWKGWKMSENAINFPPVVTPPLPWVA
jgi:hypothetical protein